VLQICVSLAKDPAVRGSYNTI